MPLHIVATPVGNLKDITLRALDVLKEADLIAAEDTRKTRHLLNTYDIHTRMISYHEHNEQKRTQELIGQLKDGLKLALVTNAGTPLVSDPGYRLVQRAIQEDVEVIPVPGATAFLTALMASGLPVDRFAFLGFPPKKAGQRQRLLKELASRRETLLFYESSRRMPRFLAEVCEFMGDRQVALCREMTKRFEEVRRGSVSELLEADSPIKGECVLAIKGLTRKSR